ncbi:MAG: hypothetical protein AB7U95_37595 [Reyranella sp.]
MPTARLLPLFFACFASIGYEIALTRFFALSSWSEYGYWVISLAMLGLAASGTVAALAARPLLRLGQTVLVLLPVLAMAAATIGWHWTTLVPFNPLELQNRQLWCGQFANIAQFYAALFPFFFMVGLYVSLVFVVNARQIGRVYAADLAGAGLGAVAVLALMFVAPPFELVACLLPALLLAAGLEAWAHPARRRWGLIALAVFLPCEASLVLANQARVNEFKDIFAPLNTRGSQVVAEIRSPKGSYLLVDSFVERHETDLSNNAGLLGVKGLPRAFGLYHDGNRIAALPREGEPDTAYFSATLDSLPYRLRPGARTLLLGAAGGFRLHEARGAGASAIEIVEPDTVLRTALLAGLGPVGPITGAARRHVLDTGPLALAGLERDGVFDVIDITREFLAQSDTNRAVLSAETLAELVHMLTPSGLLSFTVSIREFPVYAVQAMVASHAALRRAGIAQPARHVAIYRSAFNVRLLLSPTPLEPETLDAIARFCDERSFDLVHLAGRDLAGVRVYNSLSLVSFVPPEGPVESPPEGTIAFGSTAAGTHALGPRHSSGALLGDPNPHERHWNGAVPAMTPDDADPLRLEAAAALAGLGSPFHGFFQLRPPTLDRPFFTGVLPLDRLGTILGRVELVPREELAWLVNLAVLVQALALGLGVAALPLFARGTFREVKGRQFVAVLCYFAGLGVGFLTLEIFLIEKASHYLQDRTFAFGFVLAAMLVSAGAGSWLAQRQVARPQRAVTLAVLVALAWIALAVTGLDTLLAETAGWPVVLRFLVLLLVIAPLALVLGMPMALGLSQFEGRTVTLMPWAWAINGAGSVIATPLANLVMVELGYSVLLGLAFALYVVVACSLPGRGEIRPALAFPGAVQ